jgi:hypothetical protein
VVSFCKITLFFAPVLACELSVFDSIFLILGRVGGGTKVVPSLLPELPGG